MLIYKIYMYIVRFSSSNILQIKDILRTKNNLEIKTIICIISR